MSDDRGEQLARLADDQVRTARTALAAKLRRLGDAAYQAALDLDAGELYERPDLSSVHSRWQSARGQAAILAVTKQGARRMREQGDVRPRSGGAGSGRA